MKSKVSSGNQAENWVRKWLIDKDYSVHRSQRSFFKFPSGKIIAHSNDILNCIDILAIKKGEKPRFIQVTKHSGMSEKIKKLSKVDWDFDYCSVEVWHNPATGRWRLLKYDGKELKPYAEIQRGVYLEIK